LPVPYALIRRNTQIRGRIEEVQTPQTSRDWSLWPLRLFLGVTFTFAGLQKLANPAYLDPNSPTSVQATILSLQHSSPIGFLLSASAHAPKLVGVLIALGELAVGLATLAGLWVRLTAAGGLLLSLTFFLTVSFHSQPYYYGSDIVFVFAWLVPLIAGSWPEPSLDGWIRARAKRDPDPQRRALVLGGAGALALAALAGIAATLSAVIGRALNNGSPSSSAATFTPTTPQPTQPAPGTTAASPSSAPASKLPGKHIVAASEVPPGRAVRFTDANGDPAWLLHEPTGGFRAFSAICTHAGCSVSLSGGQFVCPCHSGRYSATDGSVLGGPPPSPLPRLNVQVVDGDVRLL
jgi:thiosulfate dehydrogenase [quinone] large subunit